MATILVIRRHPISFAPLMFRGFKVYPTARRILLNDREMAMGGRAFDLLVALLREKGKIVSYNEIIRQVWPSTSVNECNLRFQMAALRKALGRDRDVIKTISGRGYMMSEEPGPATAMAVPEPKGSMIGNDLRSGSDQLKPYVISCCDTRVTNVVSLADATDPLEGRDRPDCQANELRRSSTIGGIRKSDIYQRLMELQEENISLKLAIANLTLRWLGGARPQEDTLGC